MGLPSSLLCNFYLIAESKKRSRASDIQSGASPAVKKAKQVGKMKEEDEEDESDEEGWSYLFILKIEFFFLHAWLTAPISVNFVLFNV